CGRFSSALILAILPPISRELKTARPRPWAEPRRARRCRALRGGHHHARKAERHGAGAEREEHQPPGAPPEADEAEGDAETEEDCQEDEEDRFGHSRSPPVVRVLRGRWHAYQNRRPVAGRRGEQRTGAWR